MAKQYRPRACLMCGKTYTPSASRGAYCPECRPKRNKEMQKAWRETHPERKPEFHMADSEENVKKCLNCKRPKCTGYCAALS